MRTILILTISLLIASCSLLPASGQILVAQSSKARNTQPDVNAENLVKLTAANNAFAFDLYQALSARPGNLFFSPYSISTALAMTQAGARGNTLAQMNKTLHFDMLADALHPTFNALQLALNKREQNAQDANKKDFRLRLTNSIWGEKTYSFKTEFLDLLAENYSAGMRLVDFKTAPDASRQLINKWVSEQTEQKIKDLLAPGTIDVLSRLVLTNAIYFNAKWMNQFKPEITKPGTFTQLDGKTSPVPMMSISDLFGYYKGSGYQVLELPYEGQKISMLVLVPDQGKFSQVENALNSSLLAEVRKGLMRAQVNLAFPKFKIESSFSLAETLSKMGMEDAFKDDKADFSGMDGTRHLHISAVEHKAFVTVDEKGTEAAAATAIVMRDVSAPLLTVDLTVDRPFFFVILDKQSGTVLFVGRLKEPG